MSNKCPMLLKLLFVFMLLLVCKNENKDKTIEMSDGVIAFPNLTKEENESLAKFHSEFKHYFFPLIKSGGDYPDPNAAWELPIYFKEIIKKFYHEKTELYLPESWVAVFEGDLNSTIVYKENTGFEFDVYFNMIGYYESQTREYEEIQGKRKILFYVKKINNEWKLDSLPFSQTVQSLPVFIKNMKIQNPDLYKKLSEKYNIH